MDVANTACTRCACFGLASACIWCSQRSAVRLGGQPMPPETSTQNEIASTTLTAVMPTGERKQVRIAIGPLLPMPDGEWSCQIKGGELVRGPRSGIMGIDSLQALCLAIALVRFQLEDFLLKGGKLLQVDDAGCESDFPIDAAFG